MGFNTANLEVRAVVHCKIRDLQSAATTGFHVLPGTLINWQQHDLDLPYYLVTDQQPAASIWFGIWGFVDPVTKISDFQERNF